MVEENTSTEGRGLLTEAEREALAGERSDSYRYKTRSYLKRRIEKVERDAEVIAEHAPDLLADLQAAVSESDESGRESVETASTPQREQPDTSPPEPPASPIEAGTNELSEIIAEVAEETLPGSGDKQQEREEALRAVVDYLREHGAAEPKDFKNDVYPDHTARYTKGDNPAYSWWTNCMYKGLAEVADRTDVIASADQTGRWTWEGE